MLAESVVGINFCSDHGRISMGRYCKLLITLGMSAMLGYAENWSGKLLDAKCYDTSGSGATQSSDKKSREQLAKTCAPTASSTSFVFLDTKGKIYKLDDDGNAKAAAAFQSGSLKGDKDGDMHASMSGSMAGDTIKVDTVRGHGEHK